MNVKLTGQGLRVNGKLVSAYISYDDGARYGSDPAGPRISFSVRGYAQLSDEVRAALDTTVTNRTDSREDYFDNDRFVITPSHPRWAEACRAYYEYERRGNAAAAKRLAKRHDAYNAGELARRTEQLAAFDRRWLQR